MNQCRIDMNQDKIRSVLSSRQVYGDEDAFLRELLENAMDACNTRAALEWSFGTEFLELEEARAINSMRNPFRPHIVISYSSATQRLSVEDNGIGINAADIENYVAKVGASYYKSDEFALQQLRYEPVSQFGVGLLSCFMVAKAILIESKKDKSVNTAWNVSEPQSLEPITAKWIENEDTIEYISSNREASGTKITLVLHSDYARRFTMQKLVTAVSHYMLYQPFPIDIVYDDRKYVMHETNQIMDNPAADVLGLVSIPILNDLVEGCIWIYNSKQANLIGESILFQQGFLVAEGDPLALTPEWLQHMTYHLNVRKNFLTLRISRDGAADDEKRKELRRLIGQRIVEYFSQNPLGLNQYLSDGKRPVLTEYEAEMNLLGKAVSVEVFLKGREIELPIETIVHGFEGKVIRIAFISKGLFNYYRLNYFVNFKQFQRENHLIVFEKNRDIFCQMLAPYRKSQRYVISDCPGVIYDDMVADFHTIQSVVPYRNAYRLHPPKVEDDIFCLVTNEQSGRLELRINGEHHLAKMLAPVMYQPKVHNMMEVILENIKQRIINANTRRHWNKVVDFGGSFVDDWDSRSVATVQSVWCLESDFTESVNEFIESRLSERDRMELGLVGFQFHREDFINWWYMPRE